MSVGECGIFLFLDPLAGWRLVKVTKRRTKVDWAHCMKEFVDELYPNAVRIRVVLDNLNTHMPAGLYEVFEPQEAKRLLDRLEFHTTPKHASWLSRRKSSSVCSADSARIGASRMPKLRSARLTHGRMIGMPRAAPP